MNFSPASRSMTPRLLSALAMMLLCGIALAHPGHDAPDSSSLFTAGLLHPLTGMDHLLAMLAVGLWTACTDADRRAPIATPLSFLTLLLVGAVIGIRVPGIPAVEPMIVVSLLVLGLLLASRLRTPHWAGPLLVGTFALFHGMAHGAELVHGGSAVAYVSGFMLTTLALILTGMAAGYRLWPRALWLTRLAGAGIAVYGLSLWSAVA